jgi:tetratricopeptide (TPR) repeat protein
VAATVVVAGLVVLAWSALRLSPSLEVVGSLAASGKFELARTRVDEYLKVYPDDARARLMAAELALDQPRPDPQAALDHLGRCRASGRRLRAMASLDKGKAAYLLECYDRAEACWLSALKIDPLVPEATWALLDLYYLEGRRSEARRLALRQHAVEPDPGDRVRLLLELVRVDVEPPDPASLVGRFERAVARHPREFRAALALGLARVRDGKPGPGLALLREVVERYPEEIDTWDALLTGLNDAGLASDLNEELGRVPPPLADHPRLAAHSGRAAQERRDWPAAVQAYRRSLEAQPDDLVTLYRLGLALRVSGDVAGARSIEARFQAAQAALKEARQLYSEIRAVSERGRTPGPNLEGRLAYNRERLGRQEEALAWRQFAETILPRDSSLLAPLSPGK